MCRWVVLDGGDMKASIAETGSDGRSIRFSLYDSVSSMRARSCQSSIVKRSDRERRGDYREYGSYYY